MLEKLFSECKKCDGRGQWTPPMEQRGNSKTFYSPRECPDCGGAGAIPTADGEKIIELIERWRRAGKLR